MVQASCVDGTASAGELTSAVTLVGKCERLTSSLPVTLDGRASSSPVLSMETLAIGFFQKCPTVDLLSRLLLGSLEFLGLRVVSVSELLVGRPTLVGVTGDVGSLADQGVVAPCFA